MDIVVFVVAGCLSVAMVTVIFGCLRCRKRPSPVEIQRKQLQKFRKRRLPPGDRILTNRVDYVRPVVEYSETYLSPMNKKQMMLWSPPNTSLSVSLCTSPKERCTSPREHSFFDNSFQTVIEVSSVMVQHSPDRNAQMITVANQLTTYLGDCDDNSSSVSSATSSYKDNVSDTTEGKDSIASEVTESTELSDVILTIEESTAAVSADDIAADDDTNSMEANASETDALETDHVQLTIDDLQPHIRVRSESLVIDVRRRTSSHSQWNMENPLRRESKRRRTVPAVNINCIPMRDERLGLQSKTTRDDESMNASKAGNSSKNQNSVSVTKTSGNSNQCDTFEASYTQMDFIPGTTNSAKHSENECAVSLCDETDVKKFAIKQGKETFQGESTHPSNVSFHADSTNRDIYEKLTPRSHEENIYQSLKSLTLPRVHKPNQKRSKRCPRLRSRYLSDLSGMYADMSADNLVELRKTEVSNSLDGSKPDNCKSDTQYGRTLNDCTGKEQTTSKLAPSFSKTLDAGKSRLDHQSDMNASCEENDYESLSFESEDTPNKNSQADVSKNNLNHKISNITTTEDMNRRYPIPDRCRHSSLSQSSTKHGKDGENHNISNITVTEDMNRRYPMPDRCRHSSLSQSSTKYGKNPIDHNISNITVTENMNRRYSVPDRCRHSSLSQSSTKQSKDSEELFGSYPSAKKLALKSAFKHTTSPRYPVIPSISKNYENSRVDDLNSSVWNRSHNMKDPKGSLSFNGDGSYLVSPQYLSFNELKPLPMETGTEIFSGYQESLGSISPMNTYQTMKACTNMKTNGSLRKCPIRMTPVPCKNTVPSYLPGQWKTGGGTHTQNNIFTTSSPFVMPFSEDSDYFRF